MNEWQPIETAPKDGTPVLTYRNGLVQAAFFDAIDDCWWCDDGAELLGITHWMPLPNPPEDKS